MDNQETLPARLNALVGRREFLVGAGAIVLSLSSLSMISCGGSGGSGNGGGNGKRPTKTTAGKVVLPSGVSIPGLTVAGVTAFSAVDSKGAFHFDAVTGSPILVGAMSSAGKTVLLGLLDASHTTLDATSTGKALLYYAFGVGTFINKVQQAYFSALETPGTLTALASAINAAIKTHGAKWLSMPNPGVQAAMQAVITKLFPVNHATPRGRSASPQGVILTPTARTSGLQVEADGIGSAIVKNYYRRRVWLYPARVSYQTNASGTLETVDSPKNNETYPIKMAPINGLAEGALVALSKLVGGEEFYEPIESSPIPVPVFPNAKTTRLTNYTFIAVGLGAQAGDIAILDKEQKEGGIEVSLFTLVFDFALPMLIFGLIPIDQETINAVASSPRLAPLGQDLLRVIQASPEIIEAVEKGEIRTALAQILLLFTDSESLVLQLVLLVGALSENIFSKTLTDKSSTYLGEMVQEALHALLTILNIAVQGFDTLMVASDVARSESATLFKLAETLANVKVNPLGPFIHFPEERSFTATVQDASIAEGTLLTYTWTCSSDFGNLADPLGHITDKTHKSFNSSSDVVTYGPNTPRGLGGDKDTISCTVFLGNPTTGSKLGTTTVTATYFAEITPEQPTLDLGEKQVFTAGVSTHLPAGHKFEWSLASASGTLNGGATATTTTNTVTYTAGRSPLKDTLSLKVVDSAGKVLTTGSVSLTVQAGNLEGSMEGTINDPGSGIHNFAFRCTQTSTTTEYGAYNRISGFFTGPNPNGTSTPFQMAIVYPRGAPPSGSFPYEFLNQTSGPSPIFFRFNFVNGGNFQSSPFGNAGTTLKIDSVTNKGGGNFEVHFTFTVLPYGTIEGTKATGSGSFSYFVDPALG